MPDQPTEKEPSAFEKMRALAAQVVSTPKSEVDKRDKEWRAKKDAKRKA
ncbi:hypothetical protein OKA04_18175 [Luteolibacter flavescens]|uniref:Uncharacterized protein n=1 Tax=Luteolibacter flavescens TaxID=1859460 RepID=A0ABT3FTV1_9BACT|nr:hypothetical protein [Luteolibacter flavescens]MCW1886671.1 hypothetical protein [Luteolibacter flavescens]